MRRPVALTAALCVLLAWCACAHALDPSLDVNQYAHTAWRVRDGFVKGAINGLAQTQDGYLWLGTEFGLYRFDGVRAVLWQPPGGEHLPSNAILKLLASRDGTLWIGTSKGLATWKNGKLAIDPQLSSQIAFALLEDRDGTVWVGGVSALSGGRLCAIGNGGVQCRGEDGSLGPLVADLFEDSWGNLWVSVKDGFWRWRPGSSEFFSVSGEPDGVRFGGEDEEGLLIGGITGLRRLRDGKVQPFSTANISQRFIVTRMLRDGNGALWIGTDRGLVHTHKGKTDVFSVADNLTGDRVDHILEDREGNIWVATLNGLDRFRSYSISTLTTKQGLSNDNPYSVLGAKDGTVWIGTSKALDRWDRGRIVSPTIIWSPQKTDGKLNRFSPGSIFEDSERRLWAANYYGFGYLDGDRFVPVDAVPQGYVHSIVEVPPGHLWVAHQDEGIFHLLHGRVVQQIPWAGLGHTDHVNVLAADPSQRGLWLGFSRGGVAYFVDGGIREYYPSGKGLGEGEVNDLRFGPRGALWVATEGGLSRIKDGKVATLTTKNGLPCDSVLWTMEDDDGAVWLLTPCGLLRLSKSELDSWVADHTRTVSAILLDSSDGVQSRSYPSAYTPHAAKSADGKIWFTAWDGVSMIAPHNLPTNKLPPPVHIEQITADGKAYDGAKGVRLPPRVQHIDIEYTALSLVAPEKNRFRFKLEGYDRDWRDVGNRRQAFYTNLPPRNYRFRVTGCNNSGVWNEAGASLEFSVLPSFYQTNWFRVLCGVGFLALLWGIHQLRVQELQRQFNIGLEARVNERTRIARELHDTLLQNFHGLMFQFQAASNLLLRRPDEAKRSLDDAISETKKAIAESRDAIQGLRSEPMAKGNLAELLSTTSRELAESNANEHPPIFDLVEEGDRKTLSSTVSSDICHIALELMRNAYQHAQAQRIEVELRYGDSMFRLRVRDDGSGIDPKVLKEGGRARHWGLRGVRERADRIGASLDLWSEPGGGTEVQLLVPAEIAYENLPHSYRAKLVRKVKSRA